MADVITRFKLETAQYDSKLRDIAKGLKDFVKETNDGGKGLDNFSKEAIEAARALGTTASGATNARDRVRDLVGAYNDAVRQFDKLSEAQQQGDFGKSLADSLERLKVRISEAKKHIVEDIPFEGGVATNGNN
jgi:isopropylmalate/homocitrate/citramalate synthase